MSEKKTFNMIEGSLLDKIVLFALPLAISSIFQQLFNAADLAVVGRFASPEEMNIAAELRAMDLNNMTPIKAMLYLEELKERLS